MQLGDLRRALAAVLVLAAACRCGGPGVDRGAPATAPATSVPGNTTPGTTPPSTTPPSTTTPGTTPPGTTPPSAPPPAGSRPAVAGCPIFPSDDPWNTDVSAAPVDPRSAAWVASIGAGVALHPDFGTRYGIPFTTAGASTPAVPITFEYADESDPGPYPIPPGAPVEDGSDAHVIVVDTSTCKLYEAWQVVPGTPWRAGSGAVFDLATDAPRPAGWTSADAAGLPILPGLARFDEVAAGEIRHALRFTASRTQKGYVAPARHFASSVTDPSVPPMGARARLKATYDLSRLTPQARVVARALQRYGIILADNGSNWFVSGAPDARWDDSDLDALKTLRGGDFEFVEAGPVTTR